MPLNITHISPVGFVMSRGEPVGTCFIVVEDDEQISGLRHAWFVTAKHVLSDDSDFVLPELGTRFRRYGGYLVQDFPTGTWVYHEDKSIDLAVSECQPTTVPQGFQIGYVDLRTQTFDQSSELPELGVPVYYVGLFAHADRMGAEGIPMVRSGTLGAWNQVIEPYPERKLGPYVAHLIDCRSYGGFSGSPVWIQFPLTETQLRHAILGKSVDDPALRAWHSAALTHYTTWLIGLLIIHYNAGGLASGAGVGIVVPVDRIREVLTRQDCEDIREGHRIQRRRHEETPSEASVDRDTRVKIEADPDAAIKAMFKLPDE